MSAAVAPPALGPLLSDTPYKGLMPYSEEDAHFYFGREVWRDIVTDNLRAYRLTLFYGESGVGKTSLLRAGVIHGLREQARQYLAADGTPQLAVAVVASWRGDAATQVARCVEAGVANALGTEPTEHESDLESVLEAAGRRVGGKLFVILDQFEEYFLYHRPDQPDTFRDVFPRILGRRDLRVSFLISIREDAVAKLDRFKGQIPNLFDNYLRLEHLDREGAIAAIECPVKRFNELRPDEEPIELEPALVDAVLRDVETGKLDVSQPAAGGDGRPPDGEGRVETPYLQLVLTRLWNEELGAGSRVLRLQTLERLGGAQGIVETHLDAAMSALEPAEQDLAAKMFRYLVTRSRSKIAHRVSDLADWLELPEADLEPVVEKLSGGSARILRPVGDASVEIYHDVLAEAVLAWRTRHEAHGRLEEERREAEVRMRRRLIRAGIGANLVALAIAVMFALLAWRESINAEDQTKIALSRAIASSALAQLPDVDPELGVLLAIEAVGKHPTAEATDALRQAFLASKLDALLEGHDRPVTSAAFNRAGTLVMTADDRTTRLWSLETHRLSSVLSDTRGRVTAASASSDGGRVVTAMKGGGARIWDAATGKPISDLRPARTKPVPEGFRLLDTFAAFSADDAHVLALATDGAAHLWRTASGKEVAMLRADVGVVNSAAFSPDGTLVATGADDRTARLWNTASGVLVATLKGHRSEVWWTAFSADGRRLLTTGRDGTARVWDVATGKQLAVMRRQPGNGRLSPDGRQVVTFGDGRVARLWDVSTGTEKALLAPSTSGPSVNSAAFSPDGTRVVTGGTDGAVRLWDAETGQSVGLLGQHAKGVLAIAFSATGRRVVTAGADHDVRVWRVASEATAELIDLQSDPVSRAAFGVDPGRVVTVGENGVVRVLDRGTGERVAEFRGRDDRIVQAFYGPDGRDVLTVSAMGTVAAWSAGSAEPRLVLRGGGEPVVATALSPDRRRLVTLDGVGVFRVWNMIGGRGVARFDVGSVRGSIRAVAVAGGRVVAVTGDGWAYSWNEGTGKRIAAMRGPGVPRASVVALTRDGRRALAVGNRIVYVWDLKMGNRLAVVDVGGRSLAAAFSPDGKRFLTIDLTSTPRVWSVATASRVSGPPPEGFPFPVFEQPPPVSAWSADGRRIVTALAGEPFRLTDAQTGDYVVPGTVSGLLLGASMYEFRAAQFSPDGTRMVTAFQDGTARVWRVDGNGAAELVDRPMWGPDHRFFSAALSNDGRLVAAGGRDGAVQIRELATGRRLRVLRGHAGPVGGVAFSRDGELVATAGTDGDVRVWRTATGDEASTPIRHPRSVPFTSSAFNADGRLVVAGAEDGSAIVWEVESGRQLADLRHPDGGAIATVAFSRDGKWVVTASSDRTARVWAVDSGRQISVARGHEGSVTSATFNRDGTLIVTGGDDGTARVWEAKTGRSAQVLGRIDDVVPVRAAVFTPAGIVTVDADGVTRRFVCAVCRSVEELTDEARSRVRRVLTDKERQTYLYEGRQAE